MQQKTLEQKYQWIQDEVEYILKRPEIMIGSTSRQAVEIYSLKNNKLVSTQINASPGLFQIFNEIISNSVDEHLRNNVIDAIKVKLNTKTGEISVWDNGGIPIIMHSEYNLYIPDLIVSKLRSGSNFDDTENRIVAGRNGVGSSITNIFSKKFTIKSADGKKQFQRTYRDNLSVFEDFKIENSKEHYTEIKFTPDYKRFDYTIIDKDLIDWIRFKIINVAACNSGLKIVLDVDGVKEKYQYKSFKEFSDLFESAAEDIIFEESKDWSIAIKLSTKGFNHISFVNSLSVPEGGEHVEYIANQITDWLREKIKKKYKVNITPYGIKQHLFLFINSTIINPAFGSQTKQKLSTKPVDFGTEHIVSEKFLNKLFNSEICASIIDWAKKKEEEAKERDLRIENRKIHKVIVDKLIDAKNTDRSGCILLITEGDSAKSGARKYMDNKIHGLFPLRGKVKNVSKIESLDVYKNKELKDLMAAVGLKIGEKATDLRYNEIRIMSDSDTDGDAIAGLLINFFYTFWPELYEQGKVFRILTPVVVAKHNKEVLEFYSETEYNHWLHKLKETELKKWDISYKKGLAALENEEYKKIIQSPKLIQFKLDENSKELLEIWFGRETDLRKKIIVENLVEEILYTKDVKTISQYLNEEYLSYAYHVIEQRAIPSAIDGFKPTQRKIINEARKITKETKVFQCAGRIADTQHYHHGNVSLEGAIINMAQTFKNNLPLLLDIGQYGSFRDREAGAARYVSTKISPNFEYLYKDNNLLTPTFDEGVEIEPKYFLPIIPMVLINGSSGIAVGFATNILNRNPQEIINICIDILKGKKIKNKIIKPYYPDFTNNENTFFDETNKRWIFSGTYERINTNTIKITELPPNWEFEDYEIYLNELIDKRKIVDYENNSKENIEYIIKFSRSDLADFTKEDIMKLLKLTSYESENLNVLDEFGKLKQFENIYDIITHFLHFRLPYITKRKTFLLDSISKDIKILSNKILFSIKIFENKLKINDTPKTEIITQLEKFKFDKIDDSYNYLLNLPVHTLSKETTEEYKKKKKQLEDNYEEINKKEPVDIYIEDLHELLKNLK